jgi:hypothetical protein
MAIPTRHANPFDVIASERTFFVTSTTWGRRRVLQSPDPPNCFCELFTNIADKASIVCMNLW